MEGNRPAQDFETMLRVRLERHRGRLAGSSGPAMPCRGFDPERASAFLEGALTTNDATRYEEHLTGCQSCRQAVIELHRMPVDVAVPAYEAARATSHGWLATLIDSVRSAPFQWAGATAVTCAFVIVFSMVVARQTSRSVKSPEASAAAVNATAIAQATPLPEGPLQLDVPTAGTADLSAATSNSQTAYQARPAAQPVLPKPDSLDLIFGRTPNRQVAQMTPSTTAGTAPQFSVPYNAPSISPQLVQQVGGPNVAQTTQSIPPASQAASEKSELARTDMLALESRASVQRAASRESAADRPKSSGAMDFAPRANFMKGTPTPSPRPNIEDEDIRAMTRKVRDKTFRFDRGRWVDQQFKPEYFYARIRLDRGSEQYKRILNDIPSLQAFFDLGPVIVVWEFKVYEVR